MKALIIFSLIFNINNLFSNQEYLINKGDIWVLDSRSNRLSSDSKVLYYMQNDAYNTLHARTFGNWDIFSVVDSRDLQRLNKGDSIKILESKYSDRVYKVKLLSGFNKNKKFYVIAEDLKSYFKLLNEEKINE
jgi:hypothetical protein